MFLSWHLILFTIVFDSVLGNFTETFNKTHGVTKKHARVSPSKARKSNDDKVYTKRPLQTGDTFVPMELLPVAKLLLAKVKPGEGGRGIVSGSKSPEQLAEKLYRAYFLTERRIVLLTDKDLKGLDSLTALAVDGEDVKRRFAGDSITERPTHILNLNGQFVGVNPGPRRCHYKLLHKTVKPSEAISRRRHNERSTPFNKVLNMEKKMRPNRSLIVNHKSRKPNKDNKNTEVHAGNNKVKAQKNNKNGEQKKKTRRGDVGKEGKKKKTKPKSKQKRKQRPNKRRSNLTRNKKSMSQHNSRKMNSKSNSTDILKYIRNQSTEVPLTTSPRPLCRWRYFCQDPSDVDSCQLHTSCFDGSNNEPMLDKGVVDTIDKDIKEKEKTELVMHFRKMLKITSLDEDVEKIIEQHVLLVKPENLGPHEKIESLDEYFNNIVKAEYARYTTPSPNSNKDLTNTHPLFLDTNSQERDTQDKNAPQKGFEPKHVLGNSGNETVKVTQNTEPSASTDRDENQAFRIPRRPAQTQKFSPLDGTTESMKASTLKNNKKNKM